MKKAYAKRRRIQPRYFFTNTHLEENIRWRGILVLNRNESKRLEFTISEIQGDVLLKTVCVLLLNTCERRDSIKHGKQCKYYLIFQTCLKFSINIRVQIHAGCT